MRSLLATCLCATVISAGIRAEPPPSDESVLDEARVIRILLDPGASSSERDRAALWMDSEAYDSPAAVNALFAGVRDATLDESSRRRLASALEARARRDPSVAARLNALADADESRGRLALVWSIGELLRDRSESPSWLGQPVPRLVELAGDDDATVRAEALRMLARKPERLHEAPGAAVQIRAALRDADRAVRQAACGLVAHALPADDAVAALAEHYLAGDEQLTTIRRRLLHVDPESGRAFYRTLLTALDATDARVRTRAREGISGPWVEPLIPDIIARLEDERVETRRDAVLILRQLHRANAPALPALIAALDDPDDLVASYAAEAIAPHDDATLLEALRPALRSERVAVRANVASPIARIVSTTPAAMPAWRLLLDDDDASVRRRAAFGLTLPPSETDFERLWTVLAGSPHADVRGAAVQKLEQWWRQVDGRPEVRMRESLIRPRILAACRDEAGSVRARAFGAMSILRLVEPQARALAIDGLDDVDGAARREAAMALRHSGRSAAEAVPRLAALLEDADEGVRRAAANAIGPVGAGDADAARAVAARVAAVDALDLYRGDRRDELVPLYGALGRIGPATADVVPTVRAALADDDDAVAQAAVQALGAMRPTAPGVLETLTAVAAGDDDAMSSMAIRALASWSAHDEPAALKLTGAFTHADPRRRLLACALAGGSPQESPGPEARALVPGLIRRLDDDPDPTVRRAALTSLLRIEPRSARTMAALTTRLDDDFTDVRRGATRGLAPFRAGAAAAVPGLIRRLDDHDATIVAAAARTLGAIGPRAASALPALTRVETEHGDPLTRAAAERARRRIERAPGASGA